MELSERVVLVAKTIIVTILIFVLGVKLYYDRLISRKVDDLVEFRESVQNTLGTHSQAIVTLGQKAGFDWTLGPREKNQTPEQVPTPASSATSAVETETSTTDAP